MSDDNGNVSWTQAIPVRNGFILSFSHDCLGLLTAAEAYTNLGYSVIPLLGDRDPSRPKVPAVPWSAFQHRRPQPDELRQWFNEERFAGLGIVTGRVSSLAVLDFDSQNILDAFRLRFPDLMATRTVLSAGRRLPHLYFHLPAHLSLPSQKGQGIDLLSDGRYVVAPPTTIAGQSYTINRGGMPRILTERDLRRIRAFLSEYTPSNTKTSRQKEFRPPTREFDPPQTEKTSYHDLTALYHYHCKHGGRNEALFRTALYARDTGWNEPETQRCLVELHVQQPSAQPEPAARRWKEAVATLKSAFSRPPHKRRATSAQLANNVREALVQRKMTYVVRTIEGLYQAGLRPGQVFTADQAIHALKGLVGRDSVYNALKTNEQGRALFRQISPVSPLKDAYASAKQTWTLKTKKCFFVSEQKSGINKKGRRQHWYRMPHNLDLCRLFGVRASSADPLDRADLASARQTRMALHRELIKRRPGVYPRRWLARRLGVTRRTVDTYNKLIPIRSRALYHETSLNWGNIERLPLDEPLAGAFLEDLAQTRYPALRTIAARLLTTGKFLRLKERTANLYWYGDIEPPAFAAYERQTTHQEALEPSTRQPLAQPPSVRVSSTDQSARDAAAKPPSVQPLPKPLTHDQQEALAQKIYQAVNQLGGEKTKCLSLANAHRLVTTYSEEVIRAALNILQQRKVTNPAGFLVTALRAEAQFSASPP
ncbi:MAG: bifunctional DNA primase/polymerase [Anaerolineae bacterium]